MLTNKAARCSCYTPNEVLFSHEYGCSQHKPASWAVKLPPRPLNGSRAQYRATINHLNHPPERRGAHAKLVGLQYCTHSGHTVFPHSIQKHIHRHRFVETLLASRWVLRWRSTSQSPANDMTRRLHGQFVWMNAPFHHTQQTSLYDG